ncbi:hypothetical protein [Methylobacterium sp. SI9]|uniref:hypothetical protein n=1 Tax=Methylobacterium guangdongense TaxID=3138811 RepID=UPI00313ECC85
MPPTRRAPVPHRSRFARVGASEAIRKRKPHSPASIEVAASGPPVTSAIINGAENHLFSLPGTPKFIGDHKEEQIDWLARLVVSFNKQNRKQHLETIVNAYATYAASVYNQTLQAAIAEAAHRLGVKVTARKSILRLIIELHIAYGDEEDKTSKRQAEKNYSRDVTAISNLIKRGIPPDEVLELSKNKGEGLNEWVRWRATENEAVEKLAGADAGPLPVLTQSVGDKHPIEDRRNIQEQNTSKNELKPSRLADGFKHCTNILTWTCLRNGKEVTMTSITLEPKMISKILEFFDRLEDDPSNI